MMTTARLILALLFLLHAALPVWAAVTYDSDVEGVDGGGAATTLTLANVQGASGKLVVAFFSWRRNATQVMTGATYGGNAMTRICTEQYVGGGAITAWYYAGATGTGDVVGTWDAAPSNIQGAAEVLAGVDTGGTPLGTASCGTDGGVSDLAYSQSVTIPSGGMAIDGIMIRGTPVSPAADAGQTERAAQQVSSSVYLRVSTEPDSGDGTLGWSWTTNNSTKAQIVVPVNASAGSTPNTSYFRLRVNP
jgi:hypothetical protein